MKWSVIRFICPVRKIMVTDYVPYEAYIIRECGHGSWDTPDLGGGG